MLKRLLQLSFRGEEAQKGGDRTGSVALVAVTTECEHVPEVRGPKMPLKTVSFEQIYQNAEAKPPRVPYGILKVAEMVGSPHIAGMSTEAKRSSLLMALEAAGVEIEDVLQDAVLRQRALNDYEEQEQRRIKAFESAKLEENAAIQAELERITADYMARVQANIESYEREQEEFRSWQKRKQQEAQRITEAASFCVPPGSAVNGAGLTAVLERATGTGNRW